MVYFGCGVDVISPACGLIWFILCCQSSYLTIAITDNLWRVNCLPFLCVLWRRRSPVQWDCGVYVCSELVIWLAACRELNAGN